MPERGATASLRRFFHRYDALLWAYALLRFRFFLRRKLLHLIGAPDGFHRKIAIIVCPAEVHVGGRKLQFGGGQGQPQLLLLHVILRQDVARKPQALKLRISEDWRCVADLVVGQIQVQQRGQVGKRTQVGNLVPVGFQIHKVFEARNGREVCNIVL